MQNTKAKLTCRGNNYYAIITKKDDYGICHQKWLKLDATKDTKKSLLEIKFNEKIVEYEQEVANKSSQIATKLANSRVYSHLSFSKFADFWLKSKRKSIEINTYDDYIYDLKHIKKFFPEDIRIKDIAPSHIDGFFSYLFSKEVSNNTLLHYHALLNQIFKFAIKNDVVKYNVMDRVDKPKKTKFEHKFYTSNQIQDLIKTMEDENFELKVPIILSAMYGLRRSEVIGLLWSSIDFENKKIYINNKVIETNKNGKTIKYHSNKLKNQSSRRVLPLLPNAEKVLIEAKNQIDINRKKLNSKYRLNNLNYVCVDKKGLLITPHRVTTGFLKFLIAHNLPRIRFHDLRHSCASMLVANGISMKAVQEWLGHANYGTTANTYSHLDFSAKEASGKKIEEVLYSNKEKIDNFFFKDDSKFNSEKNDSSLLYENFEKNFEQIKDEISNISLSNVTKRSSNNNIYDLVITLINKVDNLQCSIDKLIC